MKKKPKVIELDAIDIKERDLIIIKKKADFDWLTDDAEAIFKFKNILYLEGNTAIYIYKGKLNEKEKNSYKNVMVG